MTFLGIVGLCLSPNCNEVISDRQVYANSVDPDQTPVLSGFTMFAILFGSLYMLKMIPIKIGGCSFSYIRILGKLEESHHEKG